MQISRRSAMQGAALGTVMAFSGPVLAQDTIKVGILHSLSGTMAISETTLKDVMLMLIDEQNKKSQMNAMEAARMKNIVGFRILLT